MSVDLVPVKRTRGSEADPSSVSVYERAAEKVFLDTHYYQTVKTLEGGTDFVGAIPLLMLRQLPSSVGKRTFLSRISLNVRVSLSPQSTSSHFPYRVLIVEDLKPQTSVGANGNSTPLPWFSSSFSGVSLNQQFTQLVAYDDTFIPTRLTAFYNTHNNGRFKVHYDELHNITTYSPVLEFKKTILPKRAIDVSFIDTNAPALTSANFGNCFNDYSRVAPLDCQYYVVVLQGQPTTRPDDLVVISGSVRVVLSDP